MSASSGNLCETMNQRIAFISASWHDDILDVCRKSFVEELGARGFDISIIDQFTVPGSLEIPLMAQLLAETGRFSVIIGAGFIVDGGIYRHDFVANAVIDGIVQVGLKTGVPVLSVVLTPHHFHGHEVHHGFFSQHMISKGRELAGSCLHTLANLEAVGKLRNPG